MPKEVNKQNTEPESGHELETGLSDTQLDKAAGGHLKSGEVISADFDYKAQRTTEFAPPGQAGQDITGSTDVAIETIELAHEGFERE